MCTHPLIVHEWKLSVLNGDNWKVEFKVKSFFEKLLHAKEFQLKIIKHNWIGGVREFGRELHFSNNLIEVTQKLCHGIN